MLFRKIFPLACAALLAGCAASTQSSPTLSAAGNDASGPAKKGILEEAGDATWRVVTAPAKLLPQKAAPTTLPQIYDAPAAVIIRRDAADESPSTQPAHP